MTYLSPGAFQGRTFISLIDDNNVLKNNWLFKKIRWVIFSKQMNTERLFIYW